MKLDLRDDQGDAQRCWSPVAWDCRQRRLFNVQNVLKLSGLAPPGLYNDMVQTYMQQAAFWI